MSKTVTLEINGEDVNFESIEITDSKPMLRCGDDRTPVNVTEKYQVAMLGAGVGLRSVVFATLNKLEVRFSIDEVLPLIEEIAGPVTSHTDEHHYGEPKSCGHVGLTQKDPAAYNVTSAQVDQLVTLWHNSDQVSLPGEHAAKAVIVVHGDYTMMHQGKDKQGDEVKVFVVNGSAAGHILRKVAKSLAAKFDIGAEIIFESLCEVAAVHAQNTVMGLGPDLPIFIIDFSDQDNSRITTAPSMRVLQNLPADVLFPQVSVSESVEV